MLHDSAVLFYGIVEQLVCGCIEFQAPCDAVNESEIEHEAWHIFIQQLRLVQNNDT